MQQPTFNLAGFSPAGDPFFGPYTPTTCDGYQFQLRNQEDLSFQIQLTSDDDSELRWQVGAYYLSIEREVGVAQLEDDGRARRLPDTGEDVPLRYHAPPPTEPQEDGHI